MGFHCGIIGLPNVGKSTLFNILTNSNIPAKNFPFCTIKSNFGIAPVFDDRLNVISSIVNPNKITTTFMEFVDIAGLVKGASKGLGLGNQFLDNIRRTNLIIHVVRCFNNDSIIHVHNNVNPIYDIEIINMELIISDLQLCQKEVLKLKKKKVHNDKIIILENCIHFLQNGNMLRDLNLSNIELKIIYDINLITLKPVIYIFNISEDSKQESYFDKLLNYMNKKNNIFITIKILEEMQNEYLKLENNNYLNLVKNDKSKINDIIQTGYKILKLQNFFTVGKKEIRSWTIPIGTTSIQAAKKIHTDFQRGFIRSKIISYVDFIKFKNEHELKKFGKIRIEGKNYIIQDGDIIEFLFKV